MCQVPQRGSTGALQAFHRGAWVSRGAWGGTQRYSQKPTPEGVQQVKTGWGHRAGKGAKEAEKPRVLGWLQRASQILRPIVTAQLSG